MRQVRLSSVSKSEMRSRTSQGDADHELRGGDSKFRTFDKRGKDVPWKVGEGMYNLNTRALSPPLDCKPLKMRSLLGLCFPSLWHLRYTQYTFVDDKHNISSAE